MWHTQQIELVYCSESEGGSGAIKLRERMLQEDEKAMDSH